MSHQDEDCSSVIDGHNEDGHDWQEEDGGANEAEADLDENDDDWMSEVEDVRLMLEEELGMENMCDRTSYAGGHGHGHGHGHRQTRKEKRSSLSEKAKTAAADETTTATSASRQVRRQLPPKASSMPAKLSLPSPERRAEALRLLLAVSGASGDGSYSSERNAGLTMLQRESKRRTYVGRTA